SLLSSSDTTISKNLSLFGSSLTSNLKRPSWATSPTLVAQAAMKIKASKDRHNLVIALLRSAPSDPGLPALLRDQILQALQMRLVERRLRASMPYLLLPLDLKN